MKRSESLRESPARCGRACGAIWLRGAASSVLAAVDAEFVHLSEMDAQLCSIECTVKLKEVDLLEQVRSPVPVPVSGGTADPDAKCSVKVQTPQDGRAAAVGRHAAGTYGIPPMMEFADRRARRFCEARVESQRRRELPRVVRVQLPGSH